MLEWVFKSSNCFVMGVRVVRGGEWSERKVVVSCLQLIMTWILLRRGLNGGCVCVCGLKEEILDVRKLLLFYNAIVMEVEVIMHID